MTHPATSSLESVHSSDAPRVFVYGTLKRGFHNESAMQGIGVSRVRKALMRGVTLYNLPNPGRPYAYPALRRGRGATLGELHTLGGTRHADDALMVLDHLEREGFEYVRVRGWVTVRGEHVRAWVYLYHSSGQLHRQKARRDPRVWWRP